MKISNTKKKASIDFDTLVKNLLAEHGDIYFEDIDGEVFIFKPLGRKAYKALVYNDNLAQVEKEDEVCKEVILYPANIDLDDYEAGIPSILYKKILEASFLDSVDSMVNLIAACKEEVTMLDIQMGCIISEAFPNLDMDDIEEWDMIKFCRMYSKAEWKLKTLRQNEFFDNFDAVSFLTANEDGNTEEEEEEYAQVQQQQKKIKKDSTYQSSNTVKVGNRKMSAEEYQQYQQFKQQYPDIEWEQDAMFTGYETQTMNTIAPALR